MVAQLAYRLVAQPFSEATRVIKGCQTPTNRGTSKCHSVAAVMSQGNAVMSFRDSLTKQKSIKLKHVI